MAWQFSFTTASSNTNPSIADIPVVSQFAAVPPLYVTGTQQNPVINLNAATNTVDGYLKHEDWNTFNNKQPAGNYITALTGDATASGPGSVALTLTTVNGSPGSYGSASNTLTATVNAKGLITSLASTPISITQFQVSGLVSALAALQPAGNYVTALTGDVSASGPGSVTSTVNTVGGVSASNVATSANTVNASATSAQYLRGDKTWVDLTSSAVAYTPAYPSDWASTPPTNVKDALDRMAALLATLSGAPIP